MAPKLDSLRCTVLKFQDDTCDVEDDFQADEVADEITEYGYLQIDHYREYKRNCGENKIKRWVSLPQGTHVEGCMSSRKSSSPAAALYSALRPRCNSSCSDLSNCDTQSTASTAASSTDFRRVRFGDGLLPGCWDDEVSEAPMQAHTSRLADWIFIDRDVCGFSLHEYAPHEDGVKDFASSPYGLMFLEELDELEYDISQQRSEVPLFNGAIDADTLSGLLVEQEQQKREERQLDKALLLAGVHVNCLHAAPEDIPEPCIMEVSI